MLDDANTPNLLSLPYLGYCRAEDPVYVRTRARVLSAANPDWCGARWAPAGGSPHVSRRHAWPMGLMMQAITSSDDAEITSCLRLLVRTHAATGLMHESFHVDDAANFTRPWFAWANTLFGELILKVLAERPHLVEGPLEP